MGREARERATVLNRRIEGTAGEILQCFDCLDEREDKKQSCPEETLRTEDVSVSGRLYLVASGKSSAPTPVTMFVLDSDVVFSRALVEFIAVQS